MGEGLLPAERPHPSLNVDRISKLIAPKDALSGAVRLANQLKLAIVVVDADGVWKKEWGDLSTACGMTTRGDDQRRSKCRSTQKWHGNI